MSYLLVSDDEIIGFSTLEAALIYAKMRYLNLNQVTIEVIR